MKPYSEDIRVRVVKSYENGEGSQRELARRYNVSLSFVQGLLKRYRQTGNIVPLKYSHRVESKVDQNSLQMILEMVEQNPQLPLSQLCERLAQERNLQISKATMWRTLRKHRPHKTSIRVTMRNSTSHSNIGTSSP